jgi:hypothetical protein
MENPKAHMVLGIISREKKEEPREKIEEDSGAERLTGVSISDIGSPLAS